MQKIADSTNTADPAGEFTEGHSAGGVPATHIKAAWLNSVQRELINVIELAGIQPDAKDDTQLGEAVSKLVASSSDFEKLKNRPTTLSGYGVTDGLHVGSPSNQRPELYADITGGDASEGSGGALVIREVQLVRGAKTNYPYAPRILFHWGGVSEGSLGMTSAGKPMWSGTAILLEGGSEITSKANKSSTLAGYGITDAHTKIEVAGLLSKVAYSAATLSGYGILDAYTRAEVDNLLVGKSSKSTTLAGYGISNAYTKAEADSLLTGKASKSTTLAGYGIADALRVGGPSDQRPALYTNTTGGESGSGTGGALMIREVQLAGASVVDYSYAPRILFHWSGVAEGALGMNSSGKLAWNAAAVLIAGGPEINAKADKSTTLSGYGITVASQSEAEQGTETTKPMTALRVFQAIAAKIVQATASVAGIARVATQSAVDSAVEDNTFVTPATLGVRLRAGFIWSSNYVVFPSWLGSLIFQWGTVATPNPDMAHDVTFPIAFPNAVKTLQVSWGYVGARTDNSIIPQIGDQTLVGFKANRQDAYTATSSPSSYINFFAIGN
ncbi:gp53-like domain-containing protein [Pseudomonas huaxiensis]|uniref:gp53-like domain-containing protein n=1 Tax=Pseudomonas huaxiensis TaxID=2213017 RepID=UPI0013008F2C|nr:hypothetical protein [Pseudomonas huaxiensis]